MELPPCDKQRFETERDAKRAVNASRVQKPGHPNAKAKKPSNAYPCRRCGGWHLTSRPKGGGRKRTRP